LEKTSILKVTVILIAINKWVSTNNLHNAINTTLNYKEGNKKNFEPNKMVEVPTPFKWK
jgi:hypothetical protein